MSRVRSALAAADDPGAVTDNVAATVETYERGLPAPWRLDATAAYVRHLANGIVGFRVEVEGLEGKWKFSQNHAERREKVATALAASADPDDRAVARPGRETGQ